MIRKTSMTPPVTRILCAVLAFASIHSPVSAQGIDAPTATLSASDFLPANALSSPYHTVAPEVINDGFANLYTINTPYGTHRVFGTDQALARIYEIEVTDYLRKQSVGGTFITAIGERVVNLGQTPYRVAKGVTGRVGRIDSVGEAVAFVPENVGRIVSGLAEGTRELFVTGARITAGAAGTQCSGIGQCVGKAGEDVWSGVNSLMGKHADARALHAKFGTNYQTENPALKAQIDRLSYTSSYTSTATKLGLANGGIDIISPLATGVGYYNNGEFVADYKDAHRGRNREKDQLATWGFTDDTITRLYKNKSYTHAMRSALIRALLNMDGTPAYADMLDAMADAPTRYLATRNVQALDYLAAFAAQNPVSRYAHIGSTPIAVLQTGQAIMPVIGDYVRPNAALDAAAARLSEQSRIGPQMHIIGRASPDLAGFCTARRIRCDVITPSRS